MSRSNPTPGHISGKKLFWNQKNFFWKYMCTLMFTAVLIVVAKMWRQQKCSLKDEWIKKMWYKDTMGKKKKKRHSGILLSHQKEGNDAICSNMDGPGDCHSKWSKSEKDKYHMTWLICEIQKKTWYKWTYLQSRNRFTDLENEFMTTRGRYRLGVWDWHVDTDTCKTNNQRPTVKTKQTNKI